MYFKIPIGKLKKTLKNKKQVCENPLQECVDFSQLFCYVFAYCEVFLQI